MNSNLMRSAVLTGILAMAPLPATPDPPGVEERRLVISQRGPNGRVVIPYETSVQQNGDVLFELGPFRAGDALFVEFEAEATPVQLARRSQPAR